jgi:hypothetical protein
MRKVQEALRLLLVCGLSQRQASRVCGVGRASVAEYLEQAQRGGPLESGVGEVERRGTRATALSAGAATAAARATDGGLGAGT